MLNKLTRVHYLVHPVSKRSWIPIQATIDRCKKIPTQIISQYHTNTFKSIRFYSESSDKNNEEDVLDIKIDTSGLHPLGASYLEQSQIKELEKAKGPLSPLGANISANINARGPMSIASFMKSALTDPIHGYYMKSDVFGRKGDFITSPEISQMFGELIGLWCASMWFQLGKPSKIHIVELGPGRGTLSYDLFSATKHIKQFSKAAHLHFIEVSPYMRRLQAQKFGLIYPTVVNPEVLSQIPVPASSESTIHSSASDMSQSINLPNFSQMSESDSEGSVTMKRPDISKDGPIESNWLPDVHLESVAGLKISWHSNIDSFSTPTDNIEPVLFIAQEFFDAMPVYQFEYTSNGWRERMIENDIRLESDTWFHTVIAPSPTPASTILRGYLPKDRYTIDYENENDFKKSSDDNHSYPKLGDNFEISPEAMAISQTIADIVGSRSGAALFIDYGYDHPSGLTLRGIKNHQFVNVYQDPGNIDLSCMVDFSALRKAAIKSSPNRKSKNLSDLVTVGPISQGEFLQNLGIDVRMARLLQKAKTSEQTENLISSFNKLVQPSDMGAIFKVLGIYSSPSLVREGFYFDTPLYKWDQDKPEPL